MQRGGRDRAIATGAVVGFGLLVLLWGTGDGRLLVRPPQGEATPRPPANPRPIDAEQQTIPDFEFSGEPGPDPINWAQVMLAASLLLVLFLVVRWLLNRSWETDVDDLVLEPGEDLSLLLEATSEAARTRVLAEGDPRNAVVACWVELEDAAERGGMQRDPAETSAEFTRRVLSMWSVDEATLDALADLYREARFSQHEITETHRERAVEALASVHDQLRSADRAR